MSFEIRDRDLLARIGKIKTKSGVLETPSLLPVINPAIQPIPPKKMSELNNCKALITNAYIIKKHFRSNAIQRGIHDLLDFDGVLMTDSGAYQILVYGDIKTSPAEIVRYQEEINTDIATILDVPTGWEVAREYAQQTIRKTLQRARRLPKMKTRDDIVWVGPVQGGNYLDLVARSAKEMGKLPFEIHALGSPTPVMEQYLFETLVDMVLTAKMNLPLDRPLHLFGAGHPFMFALAVAMGCDLFDSAAYAIYARKDRYMTEYGTAKLGKLAYFPCSCSVCSSIDPKKLRETPKDQREKLLAQHNLNVCFSEIRRIRQAVVEGRLWEHLETRAHGHPSLFQALKRLRRYEHYFERSSPVVKKRGLFFFDHAGLARPEIVRHRKRLFENYLPPREAKTLVLLPQTTTRPFHKAAEQRRLAKAIQQKIGVRARKIHICTYAAPFGVVPVEIDEVYPLSQYESPDSLDAETIDSVAEQVENYIVKANYDGIILLQRPETWKEQIVAACKRACREKDLPLATFKMRHLLSENELDDILAVIQEAVCEKSRPA